MVTLKGENDGRSALVVGLAETDILHIKDAGGVLKLPLNGEVGSNFDVLIFYGETDEILQEKLHEAQNER